MSNVQRNSTSEKKEGKRKRSAMRLKVRNRIENKDGQAGQEV